MNLDVRARDLRRPATPFPLPRRACLKACPRRPHRVFPLSETLTPPQYPAAAAASPPSPVAPASTVPGERQGHRRSRRAEPCPLLLAAQAGRVPSGRTHPQLAAGHPSPAGIPVTLSPFFPHRQIEIRWWICNLDCPPWQSARVVSAHARANSIAPPGLHLSTPSQHWSICDLNQI